MADAPNKTTAWQSKATSSLEDAHHAIYERRPSIAIECLERALEILREWNVAENQV